MITEDYVSFETSKLLKEKGFDVYGDGSYNSGIEIYKEYSPNGKLNSCATSKPNKKAYPAPTFQMAMKWLREVHNLFIVIDRHYFVVDRISHIASGFKFSIEIKTINTVYVHNDYKSYEEACEAAIKYCLENLI